MATAEIVDKDGMPLTTRIRVSRALMFVESVSGLINIAPLDFGLALRRGTMSGVVFTTEDGFMLRVNLRTKNVVTPDVSISFPPRSIAISRTEEDF